MSENIMVPASAEAAFKPPRALQVIVYGGLVVGILDGLFALIYNGLKGANLLRIFQYVASGLIGRAAFDGGVATFILGLLFHFGVAFIVASIYFAASSRLPILIRQAIFFGLLYGVAVYLVMNYVVIPLSAAPKLKFSLVNLLWGLGGHALLVGLPVALIARRSADSNGQEN